MIDINAKKKQQPDNNQTKKTKKTSKQTQNKPKTQTTQACNDTRN
jgi:hypothetical protein